MVGVRLGEVLMVTDVDPVQPEAFVTVTEYVPGVATEMVSDDAVVDHKYVEQGLPASRVTLPPEQIVVGPVIVGARLEVTSTLAEAVPAQPAADVTVTVYVPVVVTGIVCDDAPVFHKYPEYPPPASSVAVFPAHIDEAPVILGVGRAFTLTVTLAHPVVPQPFVQSV